METTENNGWSLMGLAAMLVASGLVPGTSGRAAPVAAAGLAAGASNVVRLASPDGRIEVSVHWPGPDTAERPHWAATFRGRPTLIRCGLGLHTPETGDRTFGARVWRDATGAETDPNLLELETRTLSAADTIRLRLARDGGFVAELRPAGN